MCSGRLVNQSPGSRCTFTLCGSWRGERGGINSCGLECLMALSLEKVSTKFPIIRLCNETENRLLCVETRDRNQVGNYNFPRRVRAVVEIQAR